MINHLPIQKNWKTQLSDTINSVVELLTLLNVPKLQEAAYHPENFPLRVPRAFVAKMQVGNENDPLLKQVLPDRQALKKVTGYVVDPLAENVHNPQQGVLHKYQSRVLITVTGACAIHCRYCFRQHFDYQSNTPGRQEQEAVLEYIVSQPDVSEVILSGGDPLSLNNKRLFSWISVLASLPQIATIRLHTRFPVVIPERLEPELLTFLSDIQQNPEQANIVVVIHCNHANEIDDNTANYLLRLKQTGVMVLNQAVLLAGVNDSVAAQVALSQRIFEVGVLPYYLFLLDKVEGASYFDVTEEEAIALYWQLLTKLPGYLVPKLVQELPNRPFKTPINIYNYKDNQNSVYKPD